MKLNFKERKKQAKGITLIALVVTIIVLLILAGVTIATLTGDNGILNQASKAKVKTTEAETIERVQAEVAGSYGLDGKIDLDQLNENLRKNISGLTYNEKRISEDIQGEGRNRIEQLPVTVTLNGYDIMIEGNGSVKQPNEIERAKANGTVFGDDKTTITDAYGNSVTIPKGFKIASDSATDVIGGIVIEDARYDGTIGSQFVWVPVGTVYTNIEKTTSKTITLGRYQFAEDGTPSAYTGSNKEETVAEHSYGNAIAKDIEEFKTSANSNHGYYMGRYEAGVTNYDAVSTSNDSSLTSWTGYTGANTQLVCKSGQQVWNHITQNKASELSRNMYDNTLPFTSDLMNSYAWDTAIVFIQTFGAEDNSRTYSQQTGLSTTNAPSVTGTGILSTTNKVDRQCNIFDMAGSYYEWTTETNNYSDSRSCVDRGASFGGGYSASERGEDRIAPGLYGGFPVTWAGNRIYYFSPTFILVTLAA